LTARATRADACLPTGWTVKGRDPTAPSDDAV